MAATVPTVSSSHIGKAKSKRQINKTIRGKGFQQKVRYLFLFRSFSIGETHAHTYETLIMRSSSAPTTTTAPTKIQNLR